MKKYIFTYPDFGSPNAFPEYTAHSGETVTAISEPVKDEIGNTWIDIRADDGWVGAAWLEELETV